MPELNNLVYEFLDKAGVSSLSKALLTKVNTRIQERIVNVVDENSDNTHVPSAAAVYAAISKMSHIKFKTHMGDIATVVEPNSSYIYLQRDNADDKTWMMYVYDTDLGWINIGDTEVDLSNYWSKSADDVEALKLALGFNEEVTRLETKIDQSVTDLKSEIKNLPVNRLLSETGDCTIKLSAKQNISVTDYLITKYNKLGMFTIYAERGCPDNPVSKSDSSFRGFGHITQIEDPSVTSGITGHQMMYGWVVLFDQDGNIYVNYIRRSVASGWNCPNDTSNIEEIINRLELDLSNKVDHSDMVKLTEDDIVDAVEAAYNETLPVI